FAANNECLAISDSNFGKLNPRATTFSDNALHGWGNRPQYWEWGTELQRQIRPGLVMNVEYFHNWTRNFVVTDNILVGPADYSEYCITAPLDARLPGGGGFRQCGLYDVAPAKFNTVTNVV